MNSHLSNVCNNAAAHLSRNLQKRIPKRARKRQLNTTAQMIITVFFELSSSAREKI